MGKMAARNGGKFESCVTNANLNKNQRNKQNLCVYLETHFHSFYGKPLFDLHFYL